MNLGCFNDWADIPSSANDGDYFNYTNDSDNKHKSGIYYWNVLLVGEKLKPSPDWTLLEIFPSKPYREDIIQSIMGAINVQNPDAENIMNAIIQTNNKQLDRYYRIGLSEVASHLDYTSISELPESDLVYEATIQWSAGNLYNDKTYDYTAQSFNKQNRNYVPLGDKMISRAKRILQPLAKNKNNNDVNRSGALGIY